MKTASDPPFTHSWARDSLLGLHFVSAQGGSILIRRSGADMVRLLWNIAIPINSELFDCFSMYSNRIETRHIAISQQGVFPKNTKFKYCSRTSVKSKVAELFAETLTSHTKQDPSCPFPFNGKTDGHQ